MRFFLLLMAGLVAGIAESNGQSNPRRDIQVLQDSLTKLGYIMYNEPSEPERLAANFTFVKTLVAALKTPNSFAFPFDSLGMVSILRAPDDRFRIFSWHIQLNDGSYLYYGTIQLNTPDGSLKLYPLLDKTYQIESPETAITTTDNWYGAQYYRLIPFNGDYILLGWKGHTPQVTQKVIEVLRLTNTGAQLGKAVFESADHPAHARVIYRYDRNARMYMDYDSMENRIVVDHLAPADTKYEGQYEQYGPDMTYDAWQLENGRLVLVSDVPMMNPPNLNDDRYNDPKKPLNHPKSGLSIQ
ncbi:hypothetical protein GCM10007415_47070 [Parapedobacter pyrenivorans]|uniref:Uncharacterized protein n=1 Tax=Parapedobacter pyrenivorans TaxID=1305674 RepID=A0A917MHN6_9SPHI|nr:hypothetical protein [Parapedobacter pyrenivorans]GGH05293.1 hypothetical protein GCM10007415_47070 [Parapedobacter pyrenivorans]